jgi:Mor family transcriptional regulator
MQWLENLDELTIDDLQEQHRLIATEIGLDTLVKLSKAFGGTQPYIPMMHELAKGLTHRKIREEFDGGNIRLLAVKYGVSASTVRRILQNEIAKKKCSPFDGQTSLI